MLTILFGVFLISFFLLMLKRKTHLSLHAILLIGLLVRVLFIILSSNLSNFDLDSYRIVGELTQEKINIYPTPAMVRHPYLPVMLYLEAVSLFFGDYSVIFLKSIFSLFDLAIGYLVFKATKNSHLAFLYILNPVSIFTASIHGQFDAIPLLFLLASAMMISKDKIRNFIAGLCLSFAITVKTWPVLFILPFFKKVIFPVNMRSFILAMLLLLSVFLFPIFVVLIYSFIFNSKPLAILYVLKNYQPVYGVYGLSLLTKQVFHLESIADVTRLMRIFLGLFIGFHFLLKNKNIFQQIFYFMIFLLTFSPVFGQQWLSWPIPFFLLAKEKDFGIYTVVVGLYMLANFSLWQGLIKKPFPTYVGVIVWGMIFWLLVKRVPSLLRQRSRRP